MLLYDLAKSTNEWLNNAKKKGKMHPKLHVKFIQVLDFVLWALTTESNWTFYIKSNCPLNHPVLQIS